LGHSAHDIGQSVTDAQDDAAAAGRHARIVVLYFSRGEQLDI
jgi:hypothetical protein